MIAHYAINVSVFNRFTAQTYIGFGVSSLGGVSSAFHYTGLGNLVTMKLSNILFGIGLTDSIVGMELSDSLHGIELTNSNTNMKLVKTKFTFKV